MITAPPAEPLINIFSEVWGDRVYDAVPIRPGDTVIDIGANVGVFTLRVAFACPGATIVSIEPSPLPYKYLLANLAANQVKNVVPLQAACGGRSGQVMVYSRGCASMNSIYNFDNYGSTFQPVGQAPLMTLDDVFRRCGLHTCRLLKLDCEGAEYETLYNAEPATLKAISSIAMEYHVGLNEHTPEELSAFLREHGFVVSCGPLLDEEGGFLYAWSKSGND